MLGNFNTDVTLWENARKAHRDARATFEVGRYGSVWKRGGRPERVAQFESQEAAISCLTLAGYTRTGNTFK